MSTVEIVCLANSWKHGGRCVAGLRTDGSGWVRPVSDEPEGVLQSWHYTLSKGREAALLDVLKMRLLRPQPTLHHPEDWLMDCGQWERSKKLSVLNARALLLNSLVAGPELLGDRNGKISYAAFRENPAAASLALVQPEALSWQVGRSEATGKQQIRAVFRLADIAYNLPLTDPVWQTRLAVLPAGCHPWKALGLEPLLTISLGEPFGRESYCYKLVAGVVILPPANLNQYLLQKRNLWPIIWGWMSERAGRRRSS
jgi:hypothetical protein